MFASIKNALSHIGAKMTRQTGHEKFTINQFFILAVSLQINMSQLHGYIHYILLDIPGIIYLLFLLFTFVIGYPLAVIYIFLGVYTNMKALRVYNCVPLIKGLGYTICFIEIIKLVMNIAATSSSIFMFFHRYRDAEGHIHNFYEKSPIWRTCNFSKAGDRCVSLSWKTTDYKKFVNFTCEADQLYELSISRFIQKEVLSQNDFYEMYPVGGVNNWFIIINALSCLFILIMLWLAMRDVVMKIINTMQVLGTAMNFFVFSSIIYSEVKRKKASAPSPSPIMFWGAKYHIDTISFWPMLIVHASNVSHIAIYLWLGTILPKKVKPNIAVLFVYATKLFAVVVQIIFVKSNFGMFIARHDLSFPGCTFYVNNADVMNGIIIDNLMTFDQPFIWIMLFVLSKLMLTFVFNTLISHIILDAITDEFSTLLNRNFTCSVVFVTMLFLSTLIFCTRIADTINFIWAHYEYCVVSSIVLFFTTTAINFLYSAKLFQIDYLFTYSIYPSKVMIVNLGISPIIALFSLGGVIYHLVYSGGQEFPATAKFGCLVGTVILGLPFVIALLRKIGEGLTNKMMFPDRPTRDWGPYDKAVRRKRSLFVPERNYKYRNTGVSCDHNCLPKIPEYKLEQIRRRAQYCRELINILETDTAFDNKIINLMDKTALEEELASLELEKDEYKKYLKDLANN